MRTGRAGQRNLLVRLINGVGAVQLASIGTLGRTLLASSSGELVDWLEGDWGLFFIITSLMVIPSLLLLWSIRDRLKLTKSA